ncbi:MAG: hypothetical protein R6X02_09910 [Enhygromyxa sp.]
MGDSAIDPVRTASPCSAVIAALALTLAPLGARAELAPTQNAEQQGGEPPEPVPVEPEPIEVVPPEPEPPEPAPPDPEPLEPEPPDPEPIEIIPPEAAPEVPPPTAEPVEAPPEPSVEELIPQMFRDPTPEERARGQTMRRAGIGIMGAGGVIAVTGFGLTIAYTVIGDRREAVADPVLAEVEQADKVAQVGGILLASGIAAATIGGIIYTRGQRQLEPRPLARLRVSPAFGGLVVSGQF